MVIGPHSALRLQSEGQTKDSYSDYMLSKYNTGKCSRCSLEEDQMTLTLHLPQELEQRLTQEAQRQGLPLDAYTVALLGKSLPPQERRTELITLLQTWIDEGDPEEQRDTGEYLIRALDEDRLSDRPLFPPDLKGVTW